MNHGWNILMISIMMLLISCKSSELPPLSDDCQTIPFGLIKNEATVTAFKSDSVAYGEICEQEIRVCQNGALSGGYAYSSCTVQDNSIPETITITGSGFSVTEDPQHVWFDDMEQYTSFQGTEIPAGVGQHYDSNGTEWHNKFSIDYGDHLAGRKGSLKSKNKCTIVPSKVNKTTDYYFSWWIKFSAGLTDLSYFTVAERADKFVRVWDEGNGTGNRTSWTQMHIGTNPGITRWKTIEPTPNEWVRLEIQQVGTHLKTFMNGKVMHDITGAEAFTPGETFIYRIGYDMANTDHILQDFDVRLAELAWLATPARVELSNESEWNNGEIKKYLQRTLTRTDSEITFKTYLGDLDPTVPIYAYILDEEGTLIHKKQINE